MYPPSGIPYARLYPTNQNIIAPMDTKPMFFAQITDTLFDVTIPDSNIANPQAIKKTRNPHIKNSRVLKINPTSAETVDYAYPALLLFNKKIKLTSGTLIFFNNLVIKTSLLKNIYILMVT